jgi:hypothetical protein
MYADVSHWMSMQVDNAVSSNAIVVWGILLPTSPQRPEAYNDSNATYIDGEILMLLPIRREENPNLRETYKVKLLVLTNVDTGGLGAGVGQK